MELHLANKRALVTGSSAAQGAYRHRQGATPASSKKTPRPVGLAAPCSTSQ